MAVTEPTLWQNFGAAGAPTLIPTAIIFGVAAWLRSDILRLRDSMKNAHDELSDIRERLAALEEGDRVRTGLGSEPKGGGAP